MKRVEWFNVPFGDDGRHFKIFVWRNLEDFRKTMGHDEACGLHVPTRYWINSETGLLDVRKLIGRIHFVLDNWDMEVVAHECLHGLSHFVLTEDAVSFGDNFSEMEQEEKLCYPFGRLVDAVYRKLWEIDKKR